MRKYQQLCLVIISLISIIILILYRNENSRLKYVLEVVNFFGRNDVVILEHLDNQTKATNYYLSDPSPIWQRIGNDFHIYSSFWDNNILIPGGEVISVVVGLEQSVVSFKCDLEYSSGSLYTGKFVFVREEVQSNILLSKNVNEKFIIYKFFCKINRNFGIPKYIHFTDAKSKAVHITKIRNLNNMAKQHLNLGICLDLITSNNIDNSYNRTAFLNNLNLLQYFYHYNIIGLNEFIVYDNFGIINEQLKEILRNNRINIHSFPFNFPYEITDDLVIKKILEIDCLMRNRHLSRYTILTQPNQYLYPNTNLRSPQSFLKTLKMYEIEEKRFEIIIKKICIDYHNKILSDNLFSNNATKKYNVDYFYIFKPEFTTDESKSIILDQDQVFVNEYIECKNKSALNKWRSILNKNNLNFIDVIGKELSETLQKLPNK